MLGRAGMVGKLVRLKLVGAYRENISVGEKGGGGGGGGER